MVLAKYHDMAGMAPNQENMFYSVFKKIKVITCVCLYGGVSFRLCSDWAQTC